MPSRFLVWLRDEGKSRRTIEQYVRDIERIEAWLERGDLPTLRHARTEDLRRFCAEEIPETHASLSRVRSSISAYWTFCGRELPPRAIRVPRRPRMRSRAIPREHAEKVLAAAEEMGPAQYAAVCLTYYAGLRRMEVCKLRWDDHRGCDLYVLGKGYQEDVVPFSTKARTAVEALPNGSPWIFPGQKPGSHIADGTLNLWFKAIALATGIPVTAHIMRHTAITQVYEETRDIKVAQTFARHSDPRTTSNYTRENEARLREAIESL